MNVKELRIGDYVSTIGEIRDNVIYSITELKESYVSMKDIGEAHSFMLDVKSDDIIGVPVTDNWLRFIGATYNTKTVDYILNSSKRLSFSIRPVVGDNNYVVSVVGKYKSPYKYFTYIHELQHWLWDVFEIEL